MQVLATTTIATALLGLAMADALAEIYACEGDDGVMSYQDQPCPEPEPAAAETDTEEGIEPATRAEVRQAPRETTPVDAELVAACKKRFRDEIDSVDAEIREGLMAEELEAYRKRARALSQQLSRCEYGGPNSTSNDGGSEPAGRDL